MFNLNNLENAICYLETVIFFSDEIQFGFIQNNDIYLMTPIMLIQYFNACRRYINSTIKKIYIFVVFFYILKIIKYI